MQAPMTVKEARKLLGSDYSEMSDERVQNLVNQLSLIAKFTLEDAKAKFLHRELGLNQEYTS